MHIRVNTPRLGGGNGGHGHWRGPGEEGLVIIAALGVLRRRDIKIIINLFSGSALASRMGGLSARRWAKVIVIGELGGIVTRWNCGRCWQFKSLSNTGHHDAGSGVTMVTIGQRSLRKSQTKMSAHIGETKNVKLTSKPRNQMAKCPGRQKNISINRNDMYIPQNMPIETLEMRRFEGPWRLICVVNKEKAGLCKQVTCQIEQCSNNAQIEQCWNSSSLVLLEAWSTRMWPRK